jgi:hypothetical protein
MQVPSDFWIILAILVAGGAIPSMIAVARFTICAPVDTQSVSRTSLDAVNVL